MELNAIVLRSIEKLAKIVVSVLVVLRFFYIEVWYPSELAKDISFKGHL